VFCESIGNPAGNICNIESLAAVAHRHGVPLIVDNTVATPILLRPFEWGADIVVHSLTSSWAVMARRWAGSSWTAENFPGVSSAADSRCSTSPTHPTTGWSMSIISVRPPISGVVAACASARPAPCCRRSAPFCSLQGIETVALRVERHVENARRVAEYLRGNPRVDWVNYAGFPDSPYRMLADKYLGGRASSLLTFGVMGGYAAGERFYDALKLFKRLVNIGDAKSLACHPASTTHRQMSPDELRGAGVRPEMIRLSIGIEHIDDIIEDLDQALSAATSRTRAAAVHIAE